MKSYKEILEALKGKQHKIDKNKNGKIDAHDFKLLRKEESEELEETQIDEAGDRIARSDYKVSPSGRKSHKEIVFANSGDKEDEKKEMKEQAPVAPVPDKKYIKGTKEYKEYMATKKTRVGHPTNEEVEQIDELSKGTLASYAKKATHDSRIQQRIAKDFEAQSNKVRKPDMKRAADVLRQHYQAKAHKREAGVGNAIDRLAKEEVEQIEERNKQNAMMRKSMDASRGARYKAAGNPVPDAEPEHKNAQQHNKAIGRALRKEEVEKKKDDLPFTPDAPKKNPSAVPGKYGIGPSTAKHLAKMGMKKAMKEENMEKEQFDLSDLSLEDLISLQEQALNEISKKTLGSYVSKASVDMANRTADATKKRTLAGADYAHNISRGMDAKTADKHMKSDYEDAKPDTKKAVKRMHGINKAVSRLTKEEVEQVEEKLDVAKAKMGDVIKDFQASDAPQFKGKSDEKRRQMAIAAKLEADRGTKKEETEVLSYKEFMMMLEYEAKGGVYRHTGTYGSEYAKKEREKDEQGFDAKDDNQSQKRGRGRPAGAKSGARGPRIK